VRSLPLLVASLVVAGLVGASALAQEGGKKPSPRTLEQRVEVAGKVVCIGCTLEQQEGGADSQCTLHAKHAQGLLLADGTLWTLVDNARGHAVITNERLRGKELKVFGWKFPKAQYVEVSRYQVRDGEKWIGWDWCATCGFEQGDNKDSGFCDDCKPGK